MSRQRTRHAFTIVEAAVSVGIVGVLLVASTAVFSTIAKSRLSQTESRIGLMLAQQLMTEIMQEKFQQPGTTPPFGPQSGQTRLTYNAVDCYNGYSVTSPVSMTGAAMAEYAGWAERVAVAFADPASPNSTVSASTLKKITVTVTAPSKKTYTLIGWRSKFGAYEAATAVSPATLVTGVALTVQASPAKTVYAGAHPLNGVTQ